MPLLPSLRVAFNSLFEMRACRGAPAHDQVDKSFNSLFEMQLRPQPLGVLSNVFLFQFSI